MGVLDGGDVLGAALGADEHLAVLLEIGTGPGHGEDSNFWWGIWDWKYIELKR